MDRVVCELTTHRSRCPLPSPQVQNQLAARQRMAKRAEVSLSATVSTTGAPCTAARTAVPPMAERRALSQELGHIDTVQRGNVQPRIRRLETSLRISVGTFDVAALERQLLPAIRAFGGGVRAQGLPHRLLTLQGSTLQLIMDFASPETRARADAEERRQWAAVLLLVRCRGRVESCGWIRCSLPARGMPRERWSYLGCLCMGWSQ